MSAFADWAENLREAVGELARYRQESCTGAPPVVRQIPMAGIIESLGLRKHLQEGGLTDGTLHRFLRDYLDLTVRLHHPGSMAHQVAAPHPAAALAMLVEGATNNPMAIYEMGPAAAAIEAFLLDWLRAKAGWPGGAGGVFTHGGSLANLTAIVAARSRFDKGLWAQGCRGDLALIASADCHYSIARTAGILGIGEEGVFAVPTDGSGRMQPEKIDETIQRALSAGRRPFALVANACSTATGIYDPLPEIAAVCRRHGLWLHVDGAHGAAALLSPRHRRRLEGIEQADSLVWDAHKLLCTPGLCTALLVRDAAALDHAFHEDASYLFHEKAQPGFDFIHRTVECTKASLGFRLFVVLAALGESGIAAYIDGRLELTRQAYLLLSRVPGWECPVEPQSNILCFRMPGTDEDQLQIRDRLLADGDFHLSTAVLGGRRYLRMVLTSEATTLEDLHRLVSRIQQMTKHL